MKKYRRVVLTVGKDTPFARYAAAYLPPDVPEVKEMQVVTLRGVFIKTAEMEGGRDKLAYLPLIASNEAESVTWAKTPEMNRWLRFLLVGVIVFAALLMLVAAVIFYMVRKDKAAELKHRQALRDITSKLKENP
jgi:preprotein translocase subunit SecE